VNQGEIRLGVLDCVLDARALLGECPLWSSRERVLYWVDITAQLLNRYDPRTGSNDVLGLPEPIGCVAFAAQGGFIAGLRTGIWRLDAGGAPLERLAVNPEDPRTSRFNDGRVDPRGRLFIGTIDEPKAGCRAHLYRYDQRGLTAVASGLLTSNGLAFSPDARWMYHADTPTFTVYRYQYDVETGALGARRPFIRLAGSALDRGRPDGAAVDAEGCYWIALYEGGRVQRYSPLGKLLAEYPVAASCPTMVAFGGDDLRTVYVTSARQGRSAQELARWPHSGGLFAMRVETPGLPEPTFRAESGGQRP
jgi:sugar lactone lactonase YvrE